MSFMKIRPVLKDFFSRSGRKMTSQELTLALIKANLATSFLNIHLLTLQDPPAYYALHECPNEEIFHVVYGEIYKAEPTDDPPLLCWKSTQYGGAPVFCAGVHLHIDLGDGYFYLFTDMEELHTFKINESVPSKLLEDLLEKNSNNIKRYLDKKLANVDLFAAQEQLLRTYGFSPLTLTVTDYPTDYLPEPIRKVKKQLYKGPIHIYICENTTHFLVIQDNPEYVVHYPIPNLIITEKNLQEHMDHLQYLHEQSKRVFLEEMLRDYDEMISNLLDFTLKKSISK